MAGDDAAAHLLRCNGTEPGRLLSRSDAEQIIRGLAAGTAVHGSLDGGVRWEVAGTAGFRRGFDIRPLTAAEAEAWRTRYPSGTRQN